MQKVDQKSQSSKQLLLPAKIVMFDEVFIEKKAPNTQQDPNNPDDSLQKQSSDQESEDEAEKQRQIKLKQLLHSQNLKQTANQKMVVGQGFSMDVTQFFQFKKKELKSDRQMSIFQQISGSRIAWLILLYSVTSGAMIPGWIMNIKANKLVRISWRFFMQFIMVIPFVLYEYRTGNQNVKKKYSLSYIFNTKNFIKPFVSSLATSMWFTMILSGFQWTSVSHSIVMGSLSNFFLSLGRSWRKSSHDLQSGGQILVIGGVILVLYDSIQFGPEQMSQYDYQVNNIFYLNRKWWQRITFDLSAFLMSFFMSQFSKFTSDLGSYYPPFLSMFIVNILVCINMSFSSYFINACDWDYDSFWGMFSLFSNLHFAGFMFMAIMLSLGQIISIVVITKMFPDPIIPALVMTLQPFIATLILDVTAIQKLPGNFTIIGYLFFVPGLCLILVGQCLYQRISAKKQDQQKRANQYQIELKQIKARQEQRNRKKQQKKKRESQAKLSFRSSGDRNHQSRGSNSRK